MANALIPPSKVSFTDFVFCFLFFVFVFVFLKKAACLVV